MSEGELTDDVETDLVKDKESDWRPIWSDVLTIDLDCITNDEQEERTMTSVPPRQEVRPFGLHAKFDQQCSKCSSHKHTFLKSVGLILDSV